MITIIVTVLFIKAFATLYVFMAMQIKLVVVVVVVVIVVVTTIYR